MKLLIISDTHFPKPYSMLYRQVIQRERPDHVVFLGDNIQADPSQNILELHKRFIREFSGLHKRSKTAYIIGDNDFKKNTGICEYVSNQNFMNTDPFVFKIGNMEFFHGNVEKYLSNGNGTFNRFIEDAGFRILRMTGPIGKHALPALISNMTRLVHNTDSQTYLFLGHIHLLKRSSHNIFCGTLSSKRLLYGPNDSIGYVTVRHSNFIVSSPSAITIHHLSMPRLHP